MLSFVVEILSNKNMELKLEIGYKQVLEIIKQLPANQIAKLLIDAQSIIRGEKPKKDISDFQKLLLSAPIMSEEQHNMFVENRKIFSQWRTK